MGTMTGTEAAGTVALFTALLLVTCSAATVLLVALLPPPADQTPREVLALLLGAAGFALADLALLSWVRRARLLAEASRWRAAEALAASDGGAAGAAPAEWAT
jgi:hypothetical protein